MHVCMYILIYSTFVLQSLSLQFALGMFNTWETFLGLWSNDGLSGLFIAPVARTLTAATASGVHAAASAIASEISKTVPQMRESELSI